MVRAPRATPEQDHAVLDLADPSIAELLDLKKYIESEIQSRQAKEIEELRAKVAKTAQELSECLSKSSDVRPSGISWLQIVPEAALGLVHFDREDSFPNSKVG